ncbi:MAG: alpha/beta hydrolase [Anaerolineaceae bacterium]|nr:alpha/beta hydrolase [Anaerolineaceae bacterium]
MDFSQNYVQVNDLEVFYHRAGGGDGRSKPPLVLLHGYTDNGLCWARVAHDLQNDYDVYMPDARGHGRTQGDVQIFSYEQLGADALVFIQALGLVRPFLFGHSMGAQTALIVAANAPELVRALVLEDPPFGHRESAAEQDTEFLQKMADEARVFQERPLSEKIAAIRANEPGWAEAEIIPWAESKEEYDPQIQSPSVRRRMHQYDWREAAGRVQCPVLLLTAERGIVAPETAVAVTRLIPHCKTVRLPEAGHCIHRDAYEETMQVVTDFLANHQ